MIRITAKQDGFRRCGIAHSKEAVEYPDKAFTPTQVELLKAEPMLVVEVITPAKAPAAADLIIQIGTAETPEEVDAILGDDKRATVVAAAEARKAVLAGTE